MYCTYKSLDCLDLKWFDIFDRRNAGVFHSLHALLSSCILIFDCKKEIFWNATAESSKTVWHKSVTCRVNGVALRMFIGIFSPAAMKIADLLHDSRVLQKSGNEQSIPSALVWISILCPRNLPYELCVSVCFNVFSSWNNSTPIRVTNLLDDADLFKPLPFEHLIYKGTLYGKCQMERNQLQTNDS